MSRQESVASFTTTSVTDTKGITAEIRLDPKELASGKVVTVTLEASEDGQKWHVEQSLTWQGPADEYPIIVPSHTRKGWQYRTLVESAEPLDFVAETKG